ncbi:unnamed protein product [Rhizoctonia solani]|uniref:Fungal-specific transcription factor domain protein n=1 Tax=Rhizoctonia solani TaxID=456999 RepID=A0A8H3CTY7_9AGAM|nr:unnamed protein product [Rhizoctonia solani]
MPNQPSFNGSFQHSSFASNTTKPYLVGTPPSMNAAVPMTSGQASLLEALWSLGQPPDVDLSPQHAQPTVDTRVSLISHWSSPNTGRHDTTTTPDDEDSENATGVMYRDLVLDKTSESNALPFILQGYSAWINRLALDPVKMAGVARDFVFSHFGDGDQSRWIIGLLANIGTKVGSVELVEGQHNPMLDALQVAVRRRIGAAELQPSPRESELVGVFNLAVEAIVMQFFVSPLGDAMTLIHAAAPIFRRLCPEPPSVPINLRSLLQHPLESLRRFVKTDIVVSVLVDTPMLFRYEYTIPTYPSVPASQGDGILQWMHGIPDQLLVSFAKMRTLRHDGLTPNQGTVALLDQEVREIQTFRGSSSDRFLTVIRSIVQECWGQAALVYLYMAVCSDSSDTPRVKEAFKRFMRLLTGTKPGRLPDEFLIMTILLVSPAAQRQRDREILKQRVLGLYHRDRTLISNNFIISDMITVWARADAQKRPVMWSDVAMSRKELLGA